MAHEQPSLVQLVGFRQQLRVCEQSSVLQKPVASMMRLLQLNFY
jgi:hypothetical protein